MDNQKIGKFIASLRREKGITQEELAFNLTTTRESISKWERGVMTPPAEYLLLLSKFFNVSVNEILSGERKTKTNKEEIDNVTVDILKKEEGKYRKLLKVLSLEIIVLIVGLLVYYFVSNYQTIFIYQVFGESENFSVESGLMVLSNSKSYLKLGEITNPNNLEVLEYEVYYDDNVIYKSNDDNYTLISKNKVDNYLPYKDRLKIINDTYLKITYNNSETEIIKLEFQEDFKR